MWIFLEERMTAPAFVAIGHATVAHVEPQVRAYISAGPLGSRLFCA